LNALAVCSEYLRNTFAAKSAALNAKTRVVFNGANLQLFYPREEVREPKTVLFVGRFDPQKGVFELLKAYEKVLDKHPDARLVVGGATGFAAHTETPYVRQVRELARSIEKHKHGQIHFAGYLHHDRDLPLQFQKATVFASPSIFQEPFGMVNAEAMACATPVIGANRGGIPEVIGNAGRLTDPENVQDLADTISELLANPDYSRELGQAGYERCLKMFDWRITGDAWIKLLVSTLA
jgi:spore coat protein SA